MLTIVGVGLYKKMLTIDVVKYVFSHNLDMSLTLNIKH